MEEPKYISHLKRNEDGLNDWIFQSNESHQVGVANLAENFADAFGMGAWGRVLGFFHDKGKERKSFQTYIRKVSGYDPTQKCVGDHKHAYVGGILLHRKYGRSADHLLVNQIVSHHSGLHDYDELDMILGKEIPPEVDEEVQDVAALNKPPFKSLQVSDVHHLSRLLFSCLVDADYLDTETFMKPEVAALRKGKKSLEELFPAFEQHISFLWQKAVPTELNSVRCQVQKQCIKASCSEKGFYSLTVPTGGGKTLSSVLWAIQHAMHHNMNRIIIAIPFTSIIVQTAAVLKQIFGEENVLEHHSDFNVEHINDDEIRNRMKLATENWDYPIIVTTNVQLFESMFSNKPSACRKLHNMVNSVIILDEVQTLSTDFLQPIVDTLKTYQKLFGVSVLFTTASQPVLSGLIKGCNQRARFQGIDKIEEIIPEDFFLYEKLRRVRLEFDNEGKTYDEVAAMLGQYERVLCIVNTRRDAKELYDRLPKEGVTLHLSRMMCPLHVRETIERIKRALESNTEPVIRVIATQLIEAGVDIDFPVVFRQEAGLDSVLQAAGRCNREGRLNMATTYVFSLAKEHPLPSGAMQDANSARLAVKNDVDWFAPATMTSYFQQLYCRKESFDKKEMKRLLYNPKEICFAEAADCFHLISDEGIPVIVNWRDSMKLVAQMKEQGPSYQLMKALSAYQVCVHQSDFLKLVNIGSVEEVIGGLYMITDMRQYDQKAGLCLDNHWMEEILMV